MNKIIVFANQKGGCGKSTLCLLLANYLAWQNKSVCVIDTETQQTLVQQRKDDIEFLEDDKMPYPIQGFDVGTPEIMQELMENAKAFDGYVLIDCPGNMKEDGLVPVLTQADYIICPFRYDQKTLSSTSAFVSILRELWNKLDCKEVPLLFIPNNIVRKGNIEEKRMWREVAKTFSMIGTLLESVPGRAALEKTNTYEITSVQRDVVEPTFKNVLEIIEK